MNSWCYNSFLKKKKGLKSIIRSGINGLVAGESSGVTRRFVGTIAVDISAAFEGGTKGIGAVFGAMSAAFLAESRVLPSHM